MCLEYANSARRTVTCKLHHNIWYSVNTFCFFWRKDPGRLITYLTFSPTKNHNFAVRLHKLPFACCVFIRINVRYISTTNYKRNNHIQRIPKRRSHSGKVTCLTVKWSKNLLCKPFSDISLTRRHSVTVREKKKSFITPFKIMTDNQNMNKISIFWKKNELEMTRQ